MLECPVGHYFVVHVDSVGVMGLCIMEQVVPA